MLLSYKRDFDYTKEEEFFKKFMMLLFALCLIVLTWTVYTHVADMGLKKNGKTLEAELSSDKKHAIYYIENKVRVNKDLNGYFFEDPGTDVITLYYTDSMADAVPLTSVKFFAVLYALSILGAVFSGLQLWRAFANRHADQPVPDPD